MKKEFLYVGYYIDIYNYLILKVGTTKDLNRRQKEHNKSYRKSSANHRMADDSEFTYIWSHQLSKYNTHRFEDRTIEQWKEENIGEYIRNDRFVCEDIPEIVTIKIRNTYEIKVKERVA